MADRGERRAQTDRKVAQRVRLVEKDLRFDLARWHRPYGTFRKRAPLDCGQAGCATCAHETRRPDMDWRKLESA